MPKLEDVGTSEGVMEVPDSKRSGGSVELPENKSRLGAVLKKANSFVVPSSKIVEDGESYKCEPMPFSVQACDRRCNCRQPSPVKIFAVKRRNQL
jgi:hypothetical protein